jgi:putative tryptophan/tyrosine transport system substrate-binding protein
MPHRWSRRQLVQGAGAVGLALLAACGRWPGQAQPSKLPRLGVLWIGRSGPTPQLEAFRAALRGVGYVEGQNIVIEYRFGEDRAERLPDLAAELVQLPVDVIFAGGTPAARTAQQATSTIPIVTMTGDPVGLGTVASLARPGGNVTGVTYLSAELSGKRMELLKELVPGMTRVAVLWNPMDAEKVIEYHNAEDAARALGTRLHSAPVRAASELDHAFEVLATEPPDALLILSDGLLASHRAGLTDFAARAQLPAMYPSKWFVEVGGLIAYEPNLPALFHRAAIHIDKVLKGAKPAELPVERPMHFDFVINLRTAQALGLTIPHHVLLEATEVIQ